MNNTIDIYNAQTVDVPNPKWGLSYVVGRVVGRATAVIWRWSNDRQVVAAFVGRYSAHAAILGLALLVGLLGQLAFAPFQAADVSVAESSDFVASSMRAAAEPVATPTSILIETSLSRQGASHNRVVYRHAQPLTTIPERDRLEVITYTIQSGDNLFLIAERFDLSPYTVVWSNMEALQGAPYLIQPGLTLFIPPVNGAYHTVMSGETVDSIAESYGVSAETLYNSWNDILPGKPLREGAFLVIPGGTGEDFDWEPPQPTPSAVGVASASASWGYCGNVAVSGLGGSGWFILPTGSTAVSGWYFRDYRNPGHGGLDYTCHAGDPIYAADNGVVIFAGWGGGYGNLVQVNHGNGYVTYYAHFSGFAVGCGESVYQGQLLGYCGTTGWSTGPHLHYEIRYNGVQMDPQLYE